MSRSGYSELPSILVVDDDSATRALITEALLDGGYLNTRESENGTSALEALAKNRFDLVISDLNMPGMNGLDLLNHIMNLDSPPPVIIITAYPTTSITVSAMKEGAVDFLAKPFRIEDLLLKVNLYLEQTALLREEEESARNTDWRLNDKIRELSTIKLISERIERSRKNDDDIFEDIATVALSMTTGEHCLVCLFDETGDAFHVKILQSLPGAAGEEPETESLIERMKPHFMKVAMSCKPLILNGGHPHEPEGSFMVVPLLIRNKLFGILALFNTNGGGIFTGKDLSHVQNLAARASLYLENTILYESLFSSIMNTFESLIHSVHVRDNYTERHSRSVTDLALMTAREAGCSAYEIESHRISAHLHDIGKIAVPDSILLKPGALTDDEYDVIKTHTIAGESILKSIALFEEERKIVRHHHERWDGRGYPDGLEQNDIPFLARILSVADTFDAMTSDRPYRKGLPAAVALEELLKNRWKQFDGDVVDTFVSALRQNALSTG